MKEMCSADLGTPQRYKCEEGTLKDKNNDEKKKNLMLHRNLLFIDPMDIKKEDSESKSVHCQLGSLGIKEECCELPPVIIKEESEPTSINVYKQTTENVNSIKEEAIESESVCPSESGLPLSKDRSLQHHSVHVKAEPLESNVKRSEKVLCSSHSGENMQGGACVSLPSFIEFYLQCKPKQTSHDGKMKTMNSGSEILIPDALQGRSQATVELTWTDTINTEQEVQSSNPEDLHVCDDLRKTVICKHKQKDDGRSCVTGGQYCCSDCGKQFSSNSHFQRHSQIHTRDKPYCCSECGKHFSTRSYLQKHSKIHIGEKPYCCSECGKLFSTSSYLHGHSTVHTGEKPYSCSECGKQFSKNSSLQAHRRIHTGEKPYCCFECGKRFSVNSHFHNHRRTHTGEKPYCCLDCGKRFTVSSSLQAHTKIHTGEKPYCCPECGKRFAKNSTLNIHTRVHTGEKPYCCTECGKRFTMNSSLQVHIRIHTGAKPYRCPECGKQFSVKSHFQTHKRIHTGEKPYYCSDCGKGFTTNTSLQNHTRIHTGEKPYCCSDCGKRFSGRSSFRTHRKMHAKQAQINPNLFTLCTDGDSAAC
ncbi:ZN665 protein, partial [Polypterus senegalus]